MFYERFVFNSMFFYLMVVVVVVFFFVFFFVVVEIIEVNFLLASFQMGEDYHNNIGSCKVSNEIIKFIITTPSSVSYHLCCVCSIIKRNYEIHYYNPLQPHLVSHTTYVVCVFNLYMSRAIYSLKPKDFVKNTLSF